MLCTVAVTKEDDIYIAKDISTSVASQGTTPENALSNLKEAMELYYDGKHIVIIPMHDEIKRFTLKSILEQADMSVEHFMSLRI